MTADEKRKAHELHSTEQLPMEEAKRILHMLSWNLDSAVAICRTARLLNVEPFELVLATRRASGGNQTHISAWTRRPPTQPGWYWIRRNGKTTVVECYGRCITSDGQACLGAAVPGRTTAAVLELDAEWAGPLAEPENA